jgi:hypothetical protein
MAPSLPDSAAAERGVIAEEGSPAALRLCSRRARDFGRAHRSQSGQRDGGSGRPPSCMGRYRAVGVWPSGTSVTGDTDRERRGAGDKHPQTAPRNPGRFRKDVGHLEDSGRGVVYAIGALWCSEVAAVNGLQSQSTASGSSGCGLRPIDVWPSTSQPFSRPSVVLHGHGIRLSRFSRSISRTA